MALYSKYLQFAKSTSTGVQTITGVGFKAKALLLWTAGLTASGASTEAMLSYGITDGDLQSVRFIRHPGGETSTTSAQSERTDRIAWKATATSGAAPTVQVEGEFVDFDDDGFSINWHTNDGNADIYHALLLGGDIDAKFTQVKINVNAGNSIDVTSVGFSPSAFIVMGGAADEFGAGDYNNGAPYGSVHGFGFSNATDNVCGWTLGRGTASAADCYKGQHTNRCASVRTANFSGAGELMGAHISASLSSGYTITRDAGTTANQPVQHVLCLNGVQFALGSFTAPTSIGDATITTDFQPQAIILQAIGGTASTLANAMGLATGAWNEANDFGSEASGGTWIGGVDAASPSVYRRASYEDLVLETRNASSGAAELQATVSAVTSTGATITFSAVSGVADQIIYLALSGRPRGILGSMVAGANTTVTAPLAISFGLDGDTHVDSEANTFTVHGKTKIDGTLEVNGVEIDGSGSGTVTGPVSSTDNAIARWNGTAGDTLQDSTPILQDDGRISSVTDPTSAQDAATKNYVDGLALNLGTRATVRAATTANITISTALNNGDTLDGVTLATGDLVLVKNQSGAAENGVYVVGVSPARSTQFDTYNEHPGALISVQEGTTNADTLWLCTSNAGGTLNTTAITFSAVSTSGSTGDVVGPSSSVDGEIALFDSTTGKLLKRATGTGFVRAASGAYSASKLKRNIGAVIGDGSSVIGTGVAGFLSCPVTGTITKARLLSSDAAVTSGSIVIDVWKDTYSNYPPTVADTITASAKPTISSATKAEDSTLTGWTTSVTAGDVFGFNVDSVTSLKRVTIELEIQE